MFHILSLREQYLDQEDTYESRNKMNKKNIFQKMQLRILHHFRTFSYMKYGQETSIGLILTNTHFSVEVD